MKFLFRKNDVAMVFSWRERLRIFFSGQQKFKNENLRHFTNMMAKMVSHAHEMVDDKYKFLQTHDHEVKGDE